MISTRNKGTLVGSHVAKDTQNSAKPTQLGLSGFKGAKKANFYASELTKELWTPTPDLA